MSKRLLSIVVLAMTAVGAQTCWAQSYPSRPIRLVVPFSAGGPADILARWLGQKLTGELGRPIIVDNKTGAGGLIGAQAVATANPDGYTLLFSSVGAIAIAPYISDKVSYDPEKDLTPVGRFVTAPTMLVTSATGRFSKLSDLVTYAKAHPGKVTFASAGVGTTTQLGSELLKREAGIDMVHVPYRGASPAIIDVISGSTDVLFADVPVVMPFIKSGRLKGLALGTPTRSPVLPDVPTTAEAGYKAVLVSTWYGVLAPGKTPHDIIVKLNAAINKILASPEGKAFVAEQGVQANGGSPEEFGAFIHSEAVRWSALAKAAGVKLE